MRSGRSSARPISRPRLRAILESRRPLSPRLSLVPSMQRAAKLVNSKKFSQKLLAPEELVRAVWREAVGKAISAHTNVARVVRSTLVVEVEDMTWQRQLFFLRGQIVTRVQQAMGNDAIQEVEFRVGAERRPPQRATVRESSIGAPADEADAIQDPVLKKVYRLSRKKAAV